MTTKATDLHALRETACKALITLLWLHVPISAAIGMLRGTDWMTPAATMAVLACIATWSWIRSGSDLVTRLIVAVALMGDVSLLVYQMAGNPWQPDMHMYFFAALATLSPTATTAPFLAGTVAVAVHHLALEYSCFPPPSIPAAAISGRVVLHASILILETGVLVWIVIELERLFDVTARKTEEAETARAAAERASAERSEAESHASVQRSAARRELAATFERYVAHIVNEGRGGRERRSPDRGSDSAAAPNRRASGRICGRSLNPGVAECRDGGFGHGGTDSLDRRNRQPGARSSEIAGKAAEEARKTNTVVAGLASGTQIIGEESSR